MTTTTKTLTVPPVSAAGVEATRLIYSNAKTTNPADVLAKVVEFFSANAPRIDQEVVVLAYNHGGGDVSALLAVTKEKRAEPQVGAYLRSLRAERCPDGGAERDNVLVAAFDYRSTSIIAAIDPQNTSVTKEQQTRLEALESALGRPLTGDEKAAFAALA